MKKIVNLIICIAIFLLMFNGCKQEEPNIVFTGTIEKIFDNAVLVSTTDEVSFDKATVSFDPKIQIGFNLIVGQTVKFTILPQIAESYPVQVTAIAAELVAEPALPDPERADYTASYYRADGYSEGTWDFIVNHAVNAATLAISSVRHIPVIPIEDANALADFIRDGKEYYQFDISYNENESFSSIAEKYNESYFVNHKLLILYAQEPSGSIRHQIKDTPISGDTLTVVIETIVPESYTDDMADWFIVTEFAKDDIQNCKFFDAHYEF